MTITILPEKSDQYRALSGDKESTGRTPGEALDALTSQLTEEEGGALVIVQTYKPDRFFNAAQQERLAGLMRLRESGRLTPEDERELEGLVEAELRGATARAEAMISVASVAEQRWDNLSGYEELDQAATLRREIRRDIRNIVLKIWEDSTEEERLIVRMWSEGLRIREIAEAQQISMETVHRRLKRFQRNVQKSIQTILLTSEEITIPDFSFFLGEILSSARAEGLLDR